MFYGLPLLAGLYVAGIVVVDRTWPGIEAGAFGALGLAAALLATALAGVPWARGVLAGVLAFAAGGTSLGLRLQEADRATPLSSRELTLEARVCGADGVGERRSLELCGAVEIPGPGTPSAGQESSTLPSRLIGQYRSRAPEADALSELSVGRWIRARVRLGPVGGLRNPGRPDPERRWQRRGIGARVRFVDPALVAILRTNPGRVGSVPVLASWLARIQAARISIAEGLRSEPRGSGAAGALLAALAVGDRDGLAQEHREAFARLGVAHLLAVSGLHVGLVAGLSLLLAGTALARLGDRGADWRRLAALVAVIVASAYALLAGLGASVQRALAFAWLGWAGLSLGRRPSALDLLAGAALLMGLFSPGSFFELGTQLSFAASGALLAARPGDRPGDLAEGWAGQGLYRAGISLAHFSAVALLATAPWLAWHGLPLGLFGIATNLVAIPWTHFVLLPAALAAAFAVEWGGSWAPVWVDAARCVAEITLEAVRVLAGWLPENPGRVGRPAGLALGVSGGLVFLACRLPRARQVGVIALASVAWLQSAPGVGAFPSPPRVVMLDVGQGDALLVQDDSASVLIDAGRAIPGRADLGRTAVLPALKALGVGFLDVVVVSHADIDHRGGVPSVLEGLPVGEVWLPWGGRSEAAYAGVLTAARESSIPVFETGAGAAPRKLGTMRIELLWPPPARRVGGSDSNARSLVARIDLAGWRLLLTGDIGVEIEAALVAGPDAISADVLKVPHHGSLGSSSRAFLAAVAPLRLLLSAPCGGAGGLPHPDTLARLNETGAVLDWTGRDGARVLALAEEPGLGIRAWDAGWGRKRSCPEFAVAEASAWRGARSTP